MKSIVAFILTLMLGAGLISSLTPLYAQSLQTENGITYHNGGIGYEEAQQFEAIAKDYPLWLLFSEGECGRSVSNVNVEIKNKAAQTIFSLSNAGPQLLIALPKGEYKVTASHLQKEQGARFTVGKDTHEKVVLNWKNCVEEDSLALPD